MGARKQEVWKQEMRWGKEAGGGETEKCEDRADALCLFLPTCDAAYNILASLKINRGPIQVINADFC